MKKLFLELAGIAIALCCIVSCSEPLLFSDTGSPDLPQLQDASAQLLWIGPEYKVAVQAQLKDEDGISKVQLKNGEWQLDTTFAVNNQTTYVVKDTFLVTKDVNPTKHTIEFTITNNKGGVVKGNVEVEDLSAENQVPGYNPDLLPPSITMIKPTVTKFLGFTSAPVNVDVEANITDAEIASIEVKVWGETADGQSVDLSEMITPQNTTEKTAYHVVKTFALPAGKVGQYQYIVRSVDASGNKKTVGGNITVGYVDRLYLSDAETDAEVTNQGYDNGGNARGIGTLLSMKKQGANSFVVDYYYRNEASDNIRFVAFIGNDKPFTTNQAAPTYTLNGPNILGQSATTQGTVTTDLSSANFKLPVSQKGYYHVLVDMTARTITATPFTPSRPFMDPVKYPGWSESTPWPYLAVISNIVVGSNGGWSETATSPKLMKEAGHSYLYTGTFKTTGSAVNISFTAPKDVIGSGGWFRLTAARANMKDDYGDFIDIVGAVGPSGTSPNYGFSHNMAGTFKATYDLALQRLRLIRTGN
ncbi:hypothetical protein FW774_13120 [Pedobacter sp. BS3]|uniref:hypothetical protein n=1 Tax=Pedobacter sp. BS3 TaxID=2567937 RepID=UPI0011EC2B09|nr:hypothetical protein [Pedobacter sp. BS3]TZF83226.1 hypothetical protein FW774_13120 [Pedobacter sp. BS3]